MKTHNLLLTALLSGSLLAGCLDLSSEDKDELKAFLDGYDESQNEEVSTSAALEKNYIEETEVTSDDTTGTAKLGGEIDAAALSDRTFAKFASSRSLTRAQAVSRALDAIDPEDFTVSFINGKGQKITLTIDTSKILINQPATGNPQFIIEGMGDGVNYIVEVSLSVDGGAPINLKSVAFVPKGATKSEKSVINPVSTVIAEAVQEKVKNSFFETGGDSFSQDYISDLNETLGAIIEEIVGSSGGALTAANFEDAIGSEGGIESLVSKLLSDEDVSGGLNKLEDAAVADTFSVPETTSDATEAPDIVRELFAENGDEEGGGAPDFFINFFGDQFAQGTTKTVNEIFEAIFAGVEFDTTADTTAFNKANALDAFTGQLVEIYDAIDDIATLEALATRTDAEKAQLRALREAVSDVPNVILGIFPPERKSDWQALTGSSLFTVPQAITLIFFTLDDYLADLKQFERNDDGQVEEKDGVDFNPEALLVLYGFNPEDAEQLAQYASLDVKWMQLHPGQIWLQSANGGNGGQVDVLSLFTCVDAFPEENYTINSVTLTYPKATSGTGTVTLKSEAELRGGDTAAGGEAGGEGGGDNSCYTLNPWAESDKLRDDFTKEQNGQEFTNWDGIWKFLKDNNKIITDFKSGSYEVTVNYDDVSGGTGLTKSATFNKRVITGLQNLFPKFTSPAGLPRHPEGAASPEDYEAYNTAINNFVMTTFATSDAAVFTWNAPAQLATQPLPEGVVAVYNLDIGRDVCTDTDAGFKDCRWTQVFSSWETGGQIFKTRFELPTEAKGRLAALELTDTPYQANLSISFVDETTGEHLGQGGWTQAPFRVGAVLDLNDTFNLTGMVTNVPDGSTPLSDYKVAVVKESCSEDKTATAQTHTWRDDEGNEHTETYFPWVCASATLAFAPVEDNGDGTYGYTISPTLRNMMGNNQGSYVDIRMFIDADDDDILDPYVPGNGDTSDVQGEQVFWSQSSVYFNNWGGVLRIQGNGNCDSASGTECNFYEEIVIPGATYDGPSFDGAQGSGGGDASTGNPPAITIQSSNDTANLSGNSFTWQHDMASVDHFEVVVVEWDTVNNMEVAALVASLASTASSTTITDMLNGTNGATNISADAVAAANADEGLNLTVITAIDNSKTYIWFVEAYDVSGNSLGASDDMNLSPPTQI